MPEEYYQPLNSDDFLFKDIPGISILNNSITNSKVCPNSKAVGYMKLFDGYQIAVFTKPDQFYLDNMNKMFGWEWISNDCC